MPTKMNKRDVLVRDKKNKVSDQFVVMRNNIVDKMVQQANSIHDVARAVKEAQSPTDLIERLLAVQYRCADAIQQTGGRIAHVLFVEDSTK